jgi:D-apiose dehydrogenase
MNPLRGAVIGCGFFAQNHLNAWNQIDGVKLAAVCDADKSKAAAAQQKFGVPSAYADAAEMLQTEKLDFVDVAAGVAGHRPLVELAAKFGVPVICQKPMAATLDDARAMVAACEAAGIPFMVHENFRWQHPMRQTKAAAEQIGKLTYGRLAFRTPYDVYANQPYLAEDEQFIIADLGVHVLDLARFFLGEVRSLTCLTQRVNERIRGEDIATIMMQMQSGAAVIVEASYASQTERDLFPQTLIALEGTAGSVTLDADYQLTSVACSASPYAKDKHTDISRTVTHRDVSAPTHSWSAEPFHAIQDSVLAIQTHWANCLRTGQVPETSGADNLKTLELVFAAYESARKGTTVYEF